VLEYLSDEWVQALDAALRAAGTLRELEPTAVDQLVSGVPGRGDVRYRLWIDDEGGHARAIAARDEAGTLRFTTDYATAVAIATGEQNAQIALARGNLRLGGDIDTLRRHAEALTALADVAAALRDQTRYGDVVVAPP